jgi:hypothetical protein
MITATIEHFTSFNKQFLFRLYVLVYVLLNNVCKKTEGISANLREDRKVESISAGVVEAQVQVKFSNLVHGILRQGPRSDIGVGDHTFFTGGLGDDSNTLLYGPAQQNLGRGLVMSLSNGADSIMLKKRSSLDSTVDTKGNERSRSEGTVSSDLDTLFLDPVDQGGLLEVRVKFNCSTWLDHDILCRKHTLNNTYLEEQQA